MKTTSGQDVKHAEFALHNKILIQLNLSPEGMTFAQIYDRMKADLREFSREFIRKVTAAVYELACENLITCDDIFAEPGNGSAREREALYKIAHRGKIHLLGVVLLSANSEKIDDGYPSAIVKGGGDTAPALSLPPSQISVVTQSVDRVMAEANRVAVLNRELCDCGRSVTKVCACGKEVCSAHWYDADGNHTLSEKDGMCAECVSAVELQTWGESRNGVTQ